MSDLGNKEIFAKNLKYYMNINHKDRNDVCRDLDIPYTTFAEWYNGNIYPRIDKIQILANYFDIQKSDLVENREKLRSNEKRLFPILGKVKAGYNYLASENMIGTITIDELLSDPENYYALKVVGDSMQPILFQDDIVIVHQQNDVENGQIAIILIDDEEATIKKVIKTETGIRLEAFNPYYPPREFTYEDIKKIPIKIIGKVTNARISKIFEK
nr:MAG TPA: Repressor protein CI [Caudoviricetes sp.]